MSPSFEKARRLIREFKGHMPVPLAAEMVDECILTLVVSRSIIEDAGIIVSEGET